MAPIWWAATTPSPSYASCRGSHLHCSFVPAPRPPSSSLAWVCRTATPTYPNLVAVVIHVPPCSPRLCAPQWPLWHHLTWSCCCRGHAENVCGNLGQGIAARPGARSKLRHGPNSSRRVQLIAAARLLPPGRGKWRALRRAHGHPTGVQLSQGVLRHLAASPASFTFCAGFNYIGTAVLTAPRHRRARHARSLPATNPIPRSRYQCRCPHALRSRLNRITASATTAKSGR